MRKSGVRRGSYFRYHAGATLVLMALIALLLTSCGGVGRDPGAQDDIGEPSPEQQGQEEQSSTTLQDSVTLEELTRRPDRFYGERAAVNGRVGRMIQPNIFSLTSDEAAESGESFEVEAALVAGKSGSVPELSEGQRVRVVGEVRRYGVEEIEQEQSIRLPEGLGAEFEEKPVILPGTVRVLAGGGETTGR